MPFMFRPPTTSTNGLTAHCKLDPRPLGETLEGPGCANVPPGGRDLRSLEVFARIGQRVLTLMRF
jgi:hypothetical protein